MAIQDKFNRSNHIYKITTDIDLEGGTLTIPENCTLDFQGGKIINGTVGLLNTKILPYGAIIDNYITTLITGIYAIGQCLYDTDLKKPIWYDGTKWTDALGLDINSQEINDDEDNLEMQ